MRIDSFTGPYRFLSNFWLYAVAWEGVVFPTLEHAYQWTKQETDAGRAAVLAAATPGEAKRAGRAHPVRFDWEFVKDDVMLDLLWIKFRDPYLADWLLGTGSAELVEGNAWGDTYWGVCGGVGENKLGLLLMRVRDELRDAARSRAAQPTESVQA